MQALVTGGTGFVGGNLVAGLTARGIKARVLRRESSSLAALDGLEYETVVGDILGSEESLAEAMADCNWVFHTAAVTQYWRRNTANIYEVNVGGTRRALAAAKRAGVERFVFTSSLGAMGIPRNGHLLDESSQFNIDPRLFPYGHSKHLAEREVRRAAAEGLAAVIVNPAAIVGPRDVNMLSGSIIVEAARGRIRACFPGGLNFVAVEDVVAGHLAAAERGRSGERYILAGENLTYRRLATIVCEVVGRKAPAVVLPTWSLPAAALIVAAARAVLGYRIPILPSHVRMSAFDIFADLSRRRE